MSHTPDKGTNRRTFLKGAGIAAGGIFALARLLSAARAGEAAAPAPPPAEPPLSRLSWTNRTRRIVFLARDEAARMGTNQVGPEHLCLALVSQYDCAGAELLNRLNIPLGRVHSDLMKRSPRGAGIHGDGAQMTPEAMQAMDYAREEARRLGNNYLGSEHLLLGFIRQRDGLPGDVLAVKLGADLERVRREAVLLQRERRNHV